MDGEALDDVVRRGDLDELLRTVDVLCTAHEWDHLDALRERCARAHEMGRQLWPAASHAAYRLALEAPGPWASAVLVDDAAPFALGPLPEVAAQDHTWAELASHVSRGPAAVLAAHERVLRGEDLTDVEVPGPSVLEVPLTLVAWEPAYALAEYGPDRAEFPMPAVPRLARAEVPAMPKAVDRDEACGALVDLTRAWVEGSNGRADAVVVRGGALDAISALEVRDVHTASIAMSDALALMAWVAASGGAHGRRSGAAAGRFAAWWAAGALTGLLDEWPPEPERLGERLGALEFHAWSGNEPETGWRLHLAIEDPSAKCAWAVAAVDAE